MGNLIGDPFPLYVKSQIEARQYMLGLKDRPIEVTRYLTNRMPWVRMASTTNIGKIDNPNSVGYKLKSILGDTAVLGGSALRSLLILQNFPKYEAPLPETDASPASRAGWSNIGFNYGFEDLRSYDIEYGTINTSYAEGAYGFGGAGERGYVPPWYN